MAFSIYKPGQGKYARLATGALLALLAAYGTSSLRGALGESGVMFRIGPQEFTYAQIIPIVVFALLVAAIAWGLNHRRFADFLIETETEMGRVIWPARSAVIGSAVVVIVTLVLTSVLLYGADNLLLVVLKSVGLY